MLTGYHKDFLLNHHDLMNWLLHAYGHLIELHHQVTGPEFGALIRHTYDTVDCFRNRVAAEFAEIHTGTFAHTWWAMTYTPKEVQ